MSDTKLHPVRAAADGVVHEQINERLRNFDSRFGWLESPIAAGFQHMEGRFEHVEGRFQHVNGEFQHVDSEFQHVDGRFQHLENQIEANRSHGDRQFFWTIGLIVISIILSLVTHLVASA